MKPVNPDDWQRNVPREDRACSFCNQTFSPKRATQRYCSSECQRRAMIARQRAKRKSGAAEWRTCPVCGTKFKKLAAHHMYCSDSCRLAGANQPNLSLTRPFTDTTDLLITMCMYEDGWGPEEIALFLNRDREQVAVRMETLIATGRAEFLHRRMMAWGGVHATKMRKMGFGINWG